MASYLSALTSAIVGTKELRQERNSLEDSFVNIDNGPSELETSFVVVRREGSILRDKSSPRGLKKEVTFNSRVHMRVIHE
jgi:hypothetical protein